MNTRIDGAHADFNSFSDCATCKNLISLEQKTCRAFPNGIPEAIYLGQTQHRKPINGDNGIQYEPLPDDDNHVMRRHSEQTVRGAAQNQQTGLRGLTDDTGSMVGGEPVMSAGEAVTGTGG